MLKSSASAAIRYWITVLSACSIGETVADLVSHEWGFGYVWASLLFLSIFGLLIMLERRVRSASQTRYWVAIVAMSTTGTTLADLFTRTLHLGYTWTSVSLLVLFAAVLLVKHKKHSRTSHVSASTLPHVAVQVEHTNLPDTDSYYWAAIMVASTLGTSLGDFVSNVLHFGFGRGTLLLGGLLSVVLVMEHLAKMSNEIRYWAALVLTSTIGATSGDYLTKPDGLGFGFVGVITVQVVVFVSLVSIAKRPASIA